VVDLLVLLPQSVMVVDLWVLLPQSAMVVDLWVLLPQSAMVVDLWVLLPQSAMVVDLWVLLPQGAIGVGAAVAAVVVNVPRETVRNMMRMTQATGADDASHGRSRVKQPSSWQSIELMLRHWGQHG
jgi:hypothetical protein